MSGTSKKKSSVHSAAEMYADRIPRRYTMQQEPARSKLPRVLGVLVLLAGAGGGLWYLFGGPSRYPGPLAGDDADIIESLQEFSMVDAREWLNRSQARILSGMSREVAFRFIDRLYDMGATRVYAGGGQMSMILVLELPIDTQKRKALFDWHLEWHASMFTPPVKDVGQRYLMVTLKI